MAVTVVQDQGFLSTLGKSLLESMVQSQQLELEERRVKALEKESNLRAEAAEREAAMQAAQGQAAQGTLALLAQQDPQAAQMLQQLAPQAQTPVQSFVPSFAQGGRAEPVPTEFDPTQIPGAQAQALVGQIQGLRESQSLVEQREAATEATRAQTRQVRQAIEHAEKLFTPELESLRASTRRADAAADLDRAQIAALQREEERATRTFAAQRATEQQQLFAQLAPILGPGHASRTVFGTSSPPSREELIAQEANFITQATAFAEGQDDPEAALTNLYAERARTQTAQRLGLAPEDQTFIDQAVNRLDQDPLAAYEAAKEAVSAPGSIISEPDLPILASYLKLLYPDFEIPEAERGFLRRVMERFAPVNTAEASETIQRAGGSAP